MRKKVKLKYNRLTDVVVKRASLVERGANQEPFRKMKNHKGNTMDLAGVNLGNLFYSSKKTEEKEESPPKIMAVLTKKETLDSAKKNMDKARIVKESEKDGVAAVYLTEDDINPADVLRLDDSTSVVIEGLKKAFVPWAADSDFGTSVKALGFWPSFDTASEVLWETVWKSMDSSAAGEPPVEAVNKDLKDFSDYVATLVQAVPVEAFKFEGLGVEVEPEVVPVYTVESVTEGLEKSQTALKTVLEVVQGLAKAEEVQTVADSIEALKGEMTGLEATVDGITVSVPGDDKTTSKKAEDASTYPMLFGDK